MIKCIVFDLDNTIWDGTLDANDNVKINLQIKKYIEIAYNNGIVIAVVSKNSYEQAYKKIVEFDLEKFFYKCYISWDDKYKQINELAQNLNISTEHILFVDDSEIELSEALYYIPNLKILNVKDIKLIEKYINDAQIMTDEAKNRNKIYKILEERSRQEEKMTREEFLNYCNIKVDIRIAKQEDFQRIVELLSRTNQMNLNNKLLIIEELENLRKNKSYSIYVVRMQDIFADYGIVGTTVLEELKDTIEIRYFAISCKVEGRNIGKNVIEFIKKKAQEKNKNILAKYINNSKNDKLRALFVLNEFRLNKDGYYFYNIGNKDRKDTLKKEINSCILSKVKGIVDDIGKKDYKEEYSIKEDFDSLMFIQLIVKIEKTFSVPISLSEIDIKEFDTIINISKFVEENLK